LAAAIYFNSTRSTPPTALHRHFLVATYRHPRYTNLSSLPRQRAAENPALTDNSAGAERATPTENKQPVAA